MTSERLKFSADRLGECTVPSPMRGVRFTGDGETVLHDAGLSEVKEYLARGEDPPAFEAAGPREKLYFDPAGLKCGIVTCGGLCPGLNDVIRAIVMSLHHHYGVKTVLGFRYGYEGLIPEYGHEPMLLTPDVVDNIGKEGGTILSSSRGPQDVAKMVSRLEELGISILFTVGGDGTLRGGMDIANEAKRRGLDLSVIGVPKTIDNDISYVRQSFGFITAVSEATRVIDGAHNESKGAPNGVGLVRLMGRHSGFIAAFATIASNQVNFCLVPEVPFSLDGLLKALQARLERRQHAVIVVAEGAGQDLIQAGLGRDASGNIKFGDIGVFLRDQIRDYFRRIQMPMNIKYIDPSYTIRSVPANAYDSAFCALLGHDAVHAGMSGRTNVVVGFWRNEFTHVPIPLATSKRKTIDPNGALWGDVFSSTGQPSDLS